MTTAIEEWRSMEPADRGEVLANIAAEVVRGLPKDNDPPDTRCFKTRRSDALACAGGALAELGGSARVPETIAGAVDALLDAVHRMERPWETVANIDALVGPEVSPDVRAVTEAISKLILAIRPVSDLPEYRNDPTRTRAQEIVDRVDKAKIDEALVRALELCAKAGLDSFDGSGPSRFSTRTPYARKYARAASQTAIVVPTDPSEAPLRSAGAQPVPTRDASNIGESDR